MKDRQGLLPSVSSLALVYASFYGDLAIDLHFIPWGWGRVQLKTLRKGLLLSRYDVGLLWWFLCALVFVRVMEQGRTTCKRDWQLAKLSHMKAACSFATGFPSEETLLLHCIPAKNYPVLLRQDYPRIRKTAGMYFIWNIPLLWRH